MSQTAAKVLIRANREGIPDESKCASSAYVLHQPQSVKGLSLPSEQPAHGAQRSRHTALSEEARYTCLQPSKHKMPSAESRGARKTCALFIPQEKRETEKYAYSHEMLTRPHRNKNHPRARREFVSLTTLTRRMLTVLGRSFKISLTSTKAPNKSCIFENLRELMM
eukprot:4955064-Amphidinium_carterae.2